MTTPFGLTPDEWRAGKEEIKQILAARAAAKLTIPYSELTDQLTSIRLEPNAHALVALLDEVSREEAARGRGMLSVLVVHKDGDKMPGPGFFKLAKALGRDTRDRVTCWGLELNRVCAAHAAS